jgi:hypothetical protein
MMRFTLKVEKLKYLSLKGILLRRERRAATGIGIWGCRFAEHGFVKGECGIGESK